jgi:replicative DNA helicase
MTIDAGAPRRPGLGQSLSLVPANAGEAVVPPQALEAELAIIASMILHEDSVSRALEMIESKVFYRGAHQKIFEAMAALFERNEKIDLITLQEELRKRGDLEAIGGVAALSQMTDYSTTAANIEQHILIVHAKSVLRALIEETRKIQEEAYAGNDESSAILDRAEQRIFKITDQRVRQGFISMKELMMPTMKHIEELAERKALVTGVPSGYEDLDKMTAGFQKSDLVIIAGRPSMGKCVAFDTELVLDDGSVVTIEELFRRRDSRVATLRDDFRLDRAMPSDYVDDGVKPVYEVATSLGRRVKTTITHPFLTRSGWKPLAELADGDEVAVPRALPVFGRTFNWPEDVELVALGVSRVAKSDSPLEPVLAGAPSLAAMESMDRTTAISFPLQAQATISFPPEVPATIFTLRRDQLAIFLRSYLATGVQVFDDASGPRVVYSASNERVTRQVAHLLLRFGVVSRLPQRRIADSDQGMGWQIEIADGDSLAALFEEIGDLGDSGFAAWASGRQRTRGSTVQGDVLWDRIESITFAGNQQVYDLTIPGTHNFVANDVCVHNTSFAMNIAENAAIQHQKHVAILSLEMSKEQIALRLLCSQSEVPLYKVRSGHLSEAEFRRLVNLTGGLYKAGILIDDTAAPTVLEIRAKCRRLRAEKRLDMVVIDYLQLIRSSGRSENRTQEISQITRALKGLAKELDIPVIALSQLSRAPEGRGQGERRPQLSDLRESGCLTADTRIACVDGTEPTMGELVSRGERGIAVWTMNDDRKIVPGIMTRAFPSGVKKVFAIHMASGIGVRASANHPFLTLDAWTPVDELRTGTQLAVSGNASMSVVETRPLQVSSGEEGTCAQATLELITVATSSGVFWDTITAIEPIGEQPVFDATVPGTHNFIANGIIAHNSIEQDADVVLFVFREEMYKKDDPSLRGKADIIISKQRNGPTGDVKLTFLHEFTKFVPYSPVMPGETDPGF